MSCGDEVVRCQAVALGDFPSGGHDESFQLIKGAMLCRHQILLLVLELMRQEAESNPCIGDPNTFRHLAQFL